MAAKHVAKFYPVGNSDTVHIIVDNGRRILFDFNHTSNGEDKDKPEIDLKSTLKKELVDAKRDYFDVAAFNHADLDHIQGSTDFFELEHLLNCQSTQYGAGWMPTP